MDSFNNASVLHLDPSATDHIPIIISTDGTSHLCRHLRQSFGFEEFWASHEDYESVIRDVWNLSVIGVLIYQVIQKNQGYKGNSPQVAADGV